MNETLTLAIIGHLVGDYLLQNDWMAQNKKNRDLPCAIHCLLWAISVIMFAGWHHPHSYSWQAEPNFGLSPILVFAFLFTTHFIQDRTNIIRFWMTRINRQPKFVEPPMAPWSLIVVDNVWHIVAIWAVWKFIV